VHRAFWKEHPVLRFGADRAIGPLAFRPDHCAPGKTYRAVVASEAKQSSGAAGSGLAE